MRLRKQEEYEREGGRELTYAASDEHDKKRAHDGDDRSGNGCEDLL
jgi:hypothetical protein